MEESKNPDHGQGAFASSWRAGQLGPHEVPVEVGLHRPTGFWAKWPVGEIQGRFEFNEGPSGTRNFDIKIDEF